MPVLLNHLTISADLCAVPLSRHGLVVSLASVVAVKDPLCVPDCVMFLLQYLCMRLHGLEFHLSCSDVPSAWCLLLVGFPG